MPRPSSYAVFCLKKKTPRAARRRPAAGRDAGVPDRLPTKPPPGGADLELAGSSRAPSGGLPRSEPQPDLVGPPSSGGQPPTNAQPRAALRGGSMDSGLTATRVGPPTG